MEGDDDELEDLDCLPRMLTRRGVYSRAAFISLSASNCAAFIRGRRLFAEIRYLTPRQHFPSLPGFMAIGIDDHLCCRCGTSSLSSPE